MNTDTIETPLSYVQLLTKLRESYSKTKASLMNLKATKDIFAKIPKILELFVYPAIAGAAVKKIEAKGVLEVKAIAQSIYKQTYAAELHDNRQIDMWIAPAYDNLITALETAKKHAEADVLKSNALVRMIRQTRVDIWKQKKKGRLEKDLMSELSKINI